MRGMEKKENYQQKVRETLTKEKASEGEDNIEMTRSTVEKEEKYKSNCMYCSSGKRLAGDWQGKAKVVKESNQQIKQQ